MNFSSSFDKIEELIVELWINMFKFNCYFSGNFSKDLAHCEATTSIAMYSSD